MFFCFSFILNQSFRFSFWIRLIFSWNHRRTIKSFFVIVSVFFFTRVIVALLRDRKKNAAKIRWELLTYYFSSSPSNHNNNNNFTELNEPYMIISLIEVHCITAQLWIPIILYFVCLSPSPLCLWMDTERRKKNEINEHNSPFWYSISVRYCSKTIRHKHQWNMHQSVYMLVYTSNQLFDIVHPICMRVCVCVFEYLCMKKGRERERKERKNPPGNSNRMSEKVFYFSLNFHSSSNRKLFF